MTASFPKAGPQGSTGATGTMGPAGATGFPDGWIGGNPITEMSASVGQQDALKPLFRRRKMTKAGTSLVIAVPIGAAQVGSSAHVAVAAYVPGANHVLAASAASKLTTGDNTWLEFTLTFTYATNDEYIIAVDSDVAGVTYRGIANLQNHVIMPADLWPPAAGETTATLCGTYPSKGSLAAWASSIAQGSISADGRAIAVFGKAP